MDLFLTNHFLCHKTVSDGLESCEWFVDYWDVFFINCLDSHSNGTHSPQMIHWWESDAMLNFYKSVLLKKQAHLNLGWPEGEYIWTYFKFWVNYSIVHQMYLDLQNCSMLSKLNGKVG